MTHPRLISVPLMCLFCGHGRLKPLSMVELIDHFAEKHGRVVG